MGNWFDCFTGKRFREGHGSGNKRSSRSVRKMPAEDDLLHRHALVMAMQQQQQQQLSQRFDGSMSRRIGSASSRKHTPCTSFRKQVPLILDNLETKKIVLIHGEGFGAWCWYKIIPFLEDAGLHSVTMDLSASGIDNTDINSIMTLADYTKPLIDYLNNLPEDEKVILVGHSCGGASVSYALECCPHKITKAIFLTGTMVLDGQKPFDIFSKELASAEVFMQNSQFLLYANGKDKPPSGLMFDKEQLKGLYFNQSPAKDIALALVSMRPIPLALIMEKLSLTEENYGSVRRYFIQTLDDHMLSPEIQEKLVRENPPNKVFKIKGSDHCPFFSKPQSLGKILLEIVQLT